MALSAFDLYSVGLGPSSTHTVGPMKAAKRFVDCLYADGTLRQVLHLRAELFGSLGATGMGHGSSKAVVLGLEGEDPATVDVGSVDRRVAAATSAGVLTLGGRHQIQFDPERDIVLHRRRSLPEHPNAMTFTAYGEAGTLVDERRYYSIGGGFVLDQAEAESPRVAPGRVSPRSVLVSSTFGG